MASSKSLVALIMISVALVPVTAGLCRTDASTCTGDCSGEVEWCGGYRDAQPGESGLIASNPPVMQDIVCATWQLPSQSNDHMTWSCSTPPPAPFDDFIKLPNSCAVNGDCCWVSPEIYEALDSEDTGRNTIAPADPLVICSGPVGGPGEG